MRVNNPANIKYFKGLSYPGMLGPSGPGHTDQGDPQMTFDTPQSGMNAAASLAMRKYRSGMRSPMSIIAGNKGWTPGNAQAAANIARTLGVDPNADLNLNNPAQMTAFLRALTLQEHGGASRMYNDAVYDKAANVALTSGDIAQRGQNFPAQTPSNGASAPMAAPISGGPVGGGPFALMTPPNPRNSKLAELFLSKAANAEPDGWGTLVQALANHVTGQGYGKEYDQQQKAYQGSLAQALMGAGNDTNAMTSVLLQSGDPELMKAGISARIAAENKQNPVGRYRPSKAGIVDTMTGQIVPGSQAPAEADAVEYGTTPQPYLDKDGTIKYTQLSKAGGRKDVELPEGARWLPGMELKDVGTAYVPVDKKTGARAGPAIPKDVAGEASQKEQGKAQGQAKVDLPAVESAASVILGRVDDIANDPYLPRMIGPVDSRLPNVSGDAARVQSKINQVQGEAFLQAFESLKGGGAITEVEGAKAEQAKSRLQAMGVNDPDYPKALQDFKHEVIRLRDLARQKAGGASQGGLDQLPPGAPGPDQPTPETGAPVRIMSKQGYDALPPGTRYVAPDGSIRTKQ